MTPGTHVHFGAYPKPRGTQTRVEAVADLERRLDRRYDLHHAFYRWGEVFPGTGELDDRQRGRISFLSWRAETPAGDPVRWADIAGGAHDGYLRQRAQAVRDFDRFIDLGFNHEPEGSRSDPSGTAPEFIAAFRHIRRTFEALEVANVRWVWHLSARTFDDERADSWYPGDRFVDVVAASGYSWYPGRPDEPYRGLGRIFGRSYLWAVAHDKPFMIGETGALEDPADPERKARWLDRKSVV